MSSQDTFIFFSFSPSLALPSFHWITDDSLAIVIRIHRWTRWKHTYKNNTISFANLDNILYIYMHINIVRSLQRKNERIKLKKKTKNKNKTKQQKDFYLN